MWCVPKVDSAYVARMEDVLDLYAQAHDPQRPVVCFDEIIVTNQQLHQLRMNEDLFLADLHLVQNADRC